MDGFGLQVNFKPGEAPLINVRGSTPNEFDLFLNHLLTKIPMIRQVGDALASPVLMTGLALVEQDLGGQVVQEYDAPPAPVPSYEPAPAAYQPQPVYMAPPPAVPAVAGPVATYCPRCKRAPVCQQCGHAAKIPAKSVKGGQYWVHDCPSGDRNHKGQWCNEPTQ